MNVAYINPFITATRTVFDTMIHVPLMLGRPHLRERIMPSAAVAACVKLTGAVTGTVVLYLPESVATSLASGFSGMICPNLDNDCTDALGEMTSMIAGNAKKDFPESGISISPPVVCNPTIVEYPPNTPIIVIPCTTTKGRLVLEVALITPLPTLPASTSSPAQAGTK